MEVMRVGRCGSKACKKGGMKKKKKNHQKQNSNWRNKQVKNLKCENSNHT
jgi:hypothetical protein